MRQTMNKINGWIMSSFWKFMIDDRDAFWSRAREGVLEPPWGHIDFPL